MRTLLLITVLLALPSILVAQNTDWIVEAENIDSNNYYGATVANGMIGIVSSAEPLKVSDTVLNGVYDFYGRGRASNILRGFNFSGMNLDVDGERIYSRNITGTHQRLNMRDAYVETTFEMADKV